eukprot:gene7150-466_t
MPLVQVDIRVVLVTISATLLSIIFIVLCIFRKKNAREHSIDMRHGSMAMTQNPAYAGQKPQPKIDYLTGDIHQRNRQSDLDDDERSNLSTIPSSRPPIPLPSKASTLPASRLSFPPQEIPSREKRARMPVLLKQGPLPVVTHRGNPHTHSSQPKPLHSTAPVQLKTRSLPPTVTLRTIGSTSDTNIDDVPLNRIPQKQSQKISELEQLPVIQDNNSDKIHLTSASVNVSDIEKDLAQYQLDRTSLQLISELGKGFFGTVYLAKYSPKNVQSSAVAVKIMHLDRGFDEFARRHFLLEAQIMAEFRHPNTLALVGVSTSDEPWCIVSEACEFGDLLNVLRQCEAQSVFLLLYERLLILAQLALGLSYLSSKHFIHRDVAARNCLLSGDGTVKIGDFGMSRLLQTDTSDSLPIRWMAVESLIHKKYSVKSDVWGYGVVCYEVFSNGQQPYGPMNIEVVRVEVEEGLRLEQPSGCPDDIYRLMYSMWDTNPASRPEFADIYDIIVARYRNERKLLQSARNLPSLLRKALRRAHHKDEEPYLQFQRQRKSNQVGQPSAADFEIYSGYQELDGTQIDYESGLMLPNVAEKSTEPNIQERVFKNLSRPAAERLLVSQGLLEDIQGLFLLRRSTDGINFSVSAIQGQIVIHFRVQKAATGLKIMGHQFKNVDDLIDSLRMTTKLGVPLGEYITNFTAYRGQVI